MLLYRLLLSLIALPLGLSLGLRGRGTLRERLGKGPEGPFDIWLHGASNGELTSARPLIAALRAARPDLRILVTTNTETGRALARADGHDVAYAPLDLRWVLARVLRRAQPRLMISMESEVWPNRLVLLRENGVPLAMVGARLSERSAGIWRRFGSVARAVFPGIALLSPQDAASGARFVALGVPKAAVSPVLNLKASVTAQGAASAPEFPRDHTILAASTHEGEEATILQAFAKARAARPDLRLILAPRHPKRAPELRALAETAGLPVAQRSLGEPPTPQHPVYLADTLGEMATWYAAASVTFVGGSLVPKGGHTPFEPVSEGSAILHGQSVENFADAFAQLKAADAAQMVEDVEGLAEAMITLPGSPRAAEMAARARPALAALADGDQIDALALKLLALMDESSAR